MKGRANTTGVQEQGEALPKGIYEFDIMEKADKTSKNGDPMINIKLVVANGEHKGRTVYDNILIPSQSSPAAAILSRTKRFLHCIGEPFEGEFEYDTDNWIWKKVKARVDHEAPNSYHTYVKPVIAEYILDEGTIEAGKEDDPFA